jgi:hypothetical protein
LSDPSRYREVFNQIFSSYSEMLGLIIIPRSPLYDAAAESRRSEHGRVICAVSRRYMPIMLATVSMSRHIQNFKRSLRSQKFAEPTISDDGEALASIWAPERFGCASFCRR